MSLATFLLFVTSPVVRSFVLVTLWGWFVVPAFGLPPLSKINAYGLSLILFFLTPIRNSEKKQSWPEVVFHGWFALVASSGLALALGWIATLLRTALR